MTITLKGKFYKKVVSPLQPCGLEVLDGQEESGTQDESPERISVEISPLNCLTKNTVTHLGPRSLVLPVVAPSRLSDL